MTKYKHLSHEQRVLIEDRLNHKKSIRSIASELGKSPSTVLREIQNHSTSLPPKGNNCAHKRDCDTKHVCGDMSCNKKCYCCRIPCYKYCNYYEKTNCSKLETAPYLCNGCKSLSYCEYDKTVYKSTEAQKEYKEQLSSVRSGFDVTEEELDIINRLASPMIKNGLSPYHIKETYKDEIVVSESTLRRMIDRNTLDAKNVDLRDKVKRKPRKEREIQPLSTAKIGHFYGDFLKYMEEHDTTYAEMDCVEGKKDEEATILTLTIPSLSLQLAFIMNTHTNKDVVRTLNKLEIILGYDLFNTVFPVILTDNGHEFNDIDGMELSSDKTRNKCKIFFCEPNRSDEKGCCENHHKMIRYIIPKGSSLEPYVQEDINLMMNHINSYKRKALFGKSALDLAKTVLPEDFFTALGIEEIPPDKIILRPSLLHKRKESTSLRDALSADFEDAAKI